MLGIRREHPGFYPDGPQRALPLPSGLFGLERTAPDGSETILVLANLTAEPREVPPCPAITAPEHASGTS